MSTRQKGPISGNGFLPLTFARCISPQRAGQMLGCSHMTIKRLIDDGSIKAYRLRKGGRWFVDYESVVAFAQRLLTEPQN